VRRGHGRTRRPCRRRVRGGGTGLIVLAIDTTTARESVAVVSDGQVRGDVRVSSDTHSRRLVPAIDFLLAQLGLPPSAVEGFAVTTGPGSFTGLRVGLSTVQGLAMAAGRPCFGASALDVLAARIAGEAPRLAAVMEAHRGEVFAGLYDAAAQPLGGPSVTPLEPWLRALPPGVAFLGDAVETQRAVIEANCPAPVFPRRSLFLAATLGLLAEPALRAGRGIAPADLRPLYLREAHIRRPGP
jgi:tRNA threonylcarbamoyladenosine biosynthesis protein TsaB